MAKKTRLQLAQEQVEAAKSMVNKKIDQLGAEAASLYEKLNAIQACFDAIRSVPKEPRIRYEQLQKIRSNWKLQADKIEADFKAATIKNAGGGIVGVGAGVAVAALGPSAAMGIATTFGVASTGTAISALSGAAATNAALAWLGGGALAAGGGGMAAGNALLFFSGPVGWAIATTAFLGTGLLFLKTKNEKERLENVFTLVSKRDEKSYILAIIELNERIARIKYERTLLDHAIKKIRGFGLDYNNMSEAQQYELGSYVNLMEASTQLLINPIQGLSPKYAEPDFDEFLSKQSEERAAHCTHYKETIVVLANLFYDISLDEKDVSLLVKFFKKNDKFLDMANISKDQMDAELFCLVKECLSFVCHKNNLFSEKS